MSSLAENLRAVRARIDAAARAAGRDPAEVRLLAVSKTWPAADVEALLGPAVCGLDYEVPAHMQAEVARVAPASAVRTRTGTPGLDLRAGIAEVLRGAGVRQVVHDPRCTVEDPRLFSHRRDGVTGRQAGVVWLQ